MDNIKVFFFKSVIIFLIVHANFSYIYSYIWITFPIILLLIEVNR